MKHTKLHLTSIKDQKAAGNGGDDGGYMTIEHRVENLERDMREVRHDISDMKVSIAEIKATLPHLATRGMVAQIDTKISNSTNKIIGVIFALTLALIANFIAPYLHDHSNASTIASQLQK